MAKKVTANKQINGTFGALWVNGEKWMDIESFEGKISLNFEDVNMAEDLSTRKKYTGWAGEGTITVKKVFSRGAKLIAKAAKTGKMPAIKLVGKLADPDAYGSERVSFSDVTINEATLLAFEQKTLVTEEIPFNFGDYDFLDTISA
ncbi:phage portal protein [Kurthia zopfii]|uniref:Phage-like element PBSX protein xkdM n=1 Tax=Kurthia zopfii TaxID=1650 RepID=A0A8B4Q933_9BACL|nr:phage tail tube protein [Kurthia zopfii]PWI23496.1 terminase [Kurthia zopfii]TDR35524.1 tail tube protein [Kurthia zopfii]GEK30327.1 phage portal protein [Kurthia zopfii]STX09214.1 Phage-like element PBSX protein xkdM [Kurthia zopfii]